MSQSKESTVRPGPFRFAIRDSHQEFLLPLRCVALLCAALLWLCFALLCFGLSSSLSRPVQVAAGPLARVSTGELVLLRYCRPLFPLPHFLPPQILLSSISILLAFFAFCLLVVLLFLVEFGAKIFLQPRTVFPEALQKKERKRSIDPLIAGNQTQSIPAARAPFLSLTLTLSCH